MTSVPRNRMHALKEFHRHLLQNKAAYVSMWVIILVILMAISAAYIAPYDPTAIVQEERLLPPSPRHLMGTDDLGRDILSRIVWGSRISLRVAALAVTIALILGVPLGLLSGYYSGGVDNVVMRLLDILFAFPDIILALAVIALIGKGMTNVSIALGIVYIPPLARQTRGAVLAVKQDAYVEAARATGERGGSILLREILPNATAPIAVLLTTLFGSAILAEAGLSFLGLGTMPPDPSWGLMIGDGREFLRVAWWSSTFPGLACFILVLAIARFGDGLSEILNPKLRE